jgi:hypothetical protein
MTYFLPFKDKGLPKLYLKTEFLQIYFLLKPVLHNIQSGIKQTKCFGLLSHHQALISNTQNTLNTAIGVGIVG